MGTFVVPVGMQHDADKDDDGHVAMKSADSGGTPYLDLYTDDTAASRRSDLRPPRPRSAPTRWTTEAGLRSSPTAPSADTEPAQFTVQYKGKYADQVYEDLVTVVLVGRQVLAMYYEDHPQVFVAKRAHADTASLIASYRPGSADDTT